MKEGVIQARHSGGGEMGGGGALGPGFSDGPFLCVMTCESSEISGTPSETAELP